MEYFDLMQTSPNGHSKMLRMTYDKMRQSFGPGGSPTKPLQRRQRITRISQNPREEQIVVATPDTNVNDLCNTNVNELCKMPSRPVWQPNVARPASLLDGVEVPRHRRDVVPVTASARWRGAYPTYWLMSTQVADRTHHEEVRPRQDVTPCPSLHHSSRRPPLPILLSIAPPGRRRNSQSIPLRGAYLPAPCTSIPPRAYPPARRRSSESN